MRIGSVIGAVAIVASACGGGSSAAPEPIDPEAARAVDRAVTDVAHFVGEPLNPLDPELYVELVSHDDPRLGWVLVDLGQFVFRGEPVEPLIERASAIAGEDFTIRTWWKGLGDHLITADVPAPPGLLDWKRELYGAADTAFIHLLDAEADLDWRHVVFGGVFPDTRAYGSADSCFCIPALDEPPAVPADRVDWYPDHRLVLGVEVGGAHRAYPLNLMEAHELVNDRLGGRPISLTYCTLCRSAVAHLLDELPAGVERPTLRTSGLLNRSNKLVFDRNTWSLFDQFTGEALSGPMAEAGVVLPRVTVVTSRWDEWRAAHPDTTFMNGKDGNGADYPLDPLEDRDAAGPIFPIGTFDDDLAARQLVVGTIADDGSTVAFPVDALREATGAGETVTHGGVSVVPDGSGFRLLGQDGDDLRSSEANWFAWIQRFPDTDLWQP
jgi:hypothetical protein